MSWRVVIMDLTRVLMITAWVLVTAFPIRYIWHYPHSWYRSFEGRYLVLSKTALSLILCLGPLVVLFPSLAGWSGWPVVGVGVYGLLCAVFVLLNIMLSRAVRDRKIRIREKVAARGRVP